MNANPASQCLIRTISFLAQSTALILFLGLLDSFAARAFAETPKYPLTIAGAKATVWASSELESKNDPRRYSPLKAFDNDEATAWVEGSAADGVGEWIEVEFEKAQLVAAVKIANGYQKTEKTFKENNRLSAIDVIADARPSPLFSNLEVTNKSAVVQIHKRVKSLRFVAKSIVPGKRHNDLGISEIKMEIAYVKGASECDDVVVPEKAAWGYCIKNNLPGFVLSKSNGEFRIDEAISADQRRALASARDVRVERLTDFDQGKVYIFRLTAVYDYDTDYFLHFVRADSQPLLFFHQRSRSDDGGFSYTMTKAISIKMAFPMCDSKESVLIRTIAPGSREPSVMFPVTIPISLQGTKNELVSAHRPR